MNYINILIGILSIFAGIMLIKYYQKLKSENKTGGLSFKIQTGGIGAIIIGIGLILRELF
ncbi:hypothetical protein [Aequorivita xiaoshiensis]|uniref:Uncharacterized protein n=1 Tax=Aequorivita xiaoshiensis TaxID=2874476 RepID=A0A9X1R4H7_9FLAO|nr:hypothetical protein [Aequorivita xiaoshiensis]MCG2432124.1 hypothetical protein [Aequorivita xiaoshiensis]